MSRRIKLAVGLLAAVVALNVLLSLLHAALGGTPGGPASSSYATDAGGAAAYAALLARAGHPVTQINASPHTAHLRPSGTAVLLDPAEAVSIADAAALRRFVSAGGRLVLGGPAGLWLGRIVPDAPTWSAASVGQAQLLVPEPDLVGVGSVADGGSGEWLGGSALPVLGRPGASLLDLAQVGRGTVWLLANTAALRNSGLGQGLDARLGLALAGPPPRPVNFLESYHGYGVASGLAAVPPRWWVAFALLGAAAVALMIARGRRFGPPQAQERALTPPRQQYIDALAAILSRTRPLEGSVAPVRRHLERAVAARAGLGDSPSPAELEAGALLLGVSGADARALAVPVANAEDVVRLGRSFVDVTRQSPR